MAETPWQTLTDYQKIELLEERDAERIRLEQARASDLDVAAIQRVAS